jgi:hypothetical protein
MMFTSRFSAEPDYRLSLTDPLPSHIVGAATVNQMLDEAMQGLISAHALADWAEELEQEGFTRLADELRSRLPRLPY